MLNYTEHFSKMMQFPIGFCCYVMLDEVTHICDQNGVSTIYSHGLAVNVRLHKIYIVKCTCMIKII